MKYHTQMNQTADRMIRDIKAGRTSMGAVCAEWNTMCFDNDRDDLVIMEPTRRATLINLLLGKQWLVNFGDERTDFEGNDPREWCGNDIEAAHDEASAMDEAMHDLRGDGAPVCRASTTQYVTFTHAGVTGRAEVNGKEVFVTYAGAGFQLSAARGGLFMTVVAELSKAGILPK